MDILCPEVGEVVGGSQREERKEVFGFFLFWKVREVSHFANYGQFCPNYENDRVSWQRAHPKGLC